MTIERVDATVNGKKTEFFPPLGESTQEIAPGLILKLFSGEIDKIALEIAATGRFIGGTEENFKKFKRTPKSIKCTLSNHESVACDQWFSFRTNNHDLEGSVEFRQKTNIPAIEIKEG